MLVRERPAPVEYFGVETSTEEFTIKATAKAFQILTSKLYKDKIAAVVRELSCNAYDSHVEAGRPETPFHVHLPTALEPELVIRDFGVGLSDRDVRTIFTTFFESTKENTNEQIGALGLGCKSPFSYTDTYTVKSFFNGTLSTYVCFIENALPKIKRVSRLSTDEPNGLEIRITVAPNDFRTFQQKAGAIFKWFDVQPEVSGGLFYSVPSRPKPVRSGKGWGYVPGTGQSLAVMGNVAYPLDTGVMGTHLTEFEAKLLTNFVYHFGIGELDVQAGREELSYDKTTIKAIRKRVKAASLELSSHAKMVFDGCKTMVDAARVYLRNGGGGIFELVPPRFQGKIVTGAVPCPVEGALFVRRHHRLTKDHVISRRRRGGGGGRAITETTVIEPWEDAIIFVDDLKRGGRNRFARFSNDSTKPCYLFIPAESVSREKAIKALTGYCEVRTTSSIAVQRSVASVRELDPRAYDHKTYLEAKYRSPVEVDLDEGGVYVLSKAGEPQSPDDKDLGSVVLWDIVRMCAHIRGRKTIYVVPWTLRKQFIQHEDWQSVFEVIFDAIDEKMADKDFVEQLHLKRDQELFSVGLFERSSQIAALLPKNHPFHKFVTRYTLQPSPEAVRWYPMARLLDSAQAWRGKRVFDDRKLKLHQLWRSLDGLPLLKAVVSNAPLWDAAITDLAEYARSKALDKVKHSG